MNYLKCIHSESVGNYIVYVKQTCPNHKKVRGFCVVSKPECRKCYFYEKRKVSKYGSVD